ncbi:MAG: YdeI family protein [Vicinamibacterales bacterium]
MSSRNAHPPQFKTFKTAGAFERWLSANHARASEVWLRIFKKGSGKPSITIQEGLDAALCWGWIDGQRRALDAVSYLQRYSPRTRRSPWSQINRDHVARLTAAGRITVHGQRQVDAAKADGRWEAAAPPIRSWTIDQFPSDLLTAIKANPRALRTFRTLGRQKLIGLTFRTNAMKTSSGRTRKIAALVEMLAHEPLAPQKKR